MDVLYFSHDYQGNSKAKAFFVDQPDSAVLVISGTDGNTIKLFGPPAAKGAFFKMAELFNEAHYPKPQESEHLGTVDISGENQHA